MNRCLLALLFRNSSFLDVIIIPLAKCTVNPTQSPVLRMCVASLVVGSSLYTSKTMAAAPYFSELHT